MNQSESIAKLAESLAKAQGAMEGATKDSNNPFFKSKYADLSAVWDACRKPLSENGISIVQTAETVSEIPDMVFVETVMLHTSGEWIKGRLAAKLTKFDPQSIGSAITYLRRYSLSSMVGVAPEDDDGNAASGKTPDTTVKKAEKQDKNKPVDITTPPDRQDTAPAPENAATGTPGPSAGERKLATREQITKIQIMMKERGITKREDILADLTGFCERAIHSSKELTLQEASQWIEANSPEAA